MNLFLIICLILYSNELQGDSQEYYNCINPTKKINNSSQCTSIVIPDSDGCKCCAMKISINGNTSYNCFALENEHTKTKESLNEFISNQGLSALFSKVGGNIDIDCGEEITLTQNIKKLSDTFLNCYENHLNGVENENDCFEHEIPKEENCKCCYLETSRKFKNGSFIKDKRCYIIDDLYFSQEKNLTNFLLDQSNVDSIEQIKNINVTINCKNHEKYYFPNNFKIDNLPPSNDIINNSEDLKDNNDSKDSEDSRDNENNDEEVSFRDKIKNRNNNSSGLKTWIIVMIATIFSIILLAVMIFVIMNKIKVIKNNEIPKDNNNGDESHKEINIHNN